ncbi:hypothetical protein Cus16_1515 [Curtobacterium sp. ER1/6]|nr:hypothetical protein Cus16_1515 [Curtobacterium sp. ER1/6]
MVVAANKYTTADGTTAYLYQLRGPKGATVQHGAHTGTWNTAGTFDDRGMYFLTSTIVPDGGYDFRSKIGNTTSARTTIPASQIVEALPAPEVITANKYTNADGTTAYLYQLRGPKGATVQHGAHTGTWNTAGTFDDHGMYFLTSTIVPDGGYDFRSKIGNTTSAKTTIPASNITNGVVAPIDASASFSPVLAENATIGGTATAGATITISNGEELAHAEADDAGRWSTQVNAPNKSGVAALTVAQSVGPVELSSRSISVDYGPGIVINDLDDDVAPGDPITISGTAQAGVEIRVFEKGANDPLKSAQADEHGAWHVADLELEDREYQLVAEGVSKGYNRTSAEITVKPRKSPVPAPVSVKGEFPTDVHQWAHIKGSGIAQGATVTIKQGDNLIAEGPANGTNFDFQIDPSKVGWGTQHFTVTQTVNENTSAAANVSLDYAQNTPPVITSPAKFGKISPTNQVFEGTGVDGAELGIRRAAVDGYIAETNLEGSDKWTMTVNDGITLDDGWYQFYIHQFTKGGKFNQNDTSLQVGS